MEQVIIIGGGFGGLNAAQALKNTPVKILLIDQVNHHLFQPLLYQVATAALSVESIASPIREILRNQKNVEVLLASIAQIDKAKKKVIASDGQSFSFDDLIIATGSRHSYFGHDQWETLAPGLKTAEDGLKIREKILMAFEKAERCEDRLKAAEFLRFAVIGAGPTGVEMAGSIAEFAHRTLFKNFRRINPATSKIFLIEGASQVLPTFGPHLAREAEGDLKKLGVEIMLNRMVTEITPEGIYMGGHFLPVRTVVWAAGNQASPLVKTLEVPLDKLGRVIVEPDLTIPDQPNIFVIGDAACFKYNLEEALPAIAPVAIQQGRYVAKIIKNKTPPSERKPFVYFDKGMVATVGGGKAVAMLRKFQFTGLMAWFIWCFVHIFYLISFGNRLMVMMEWIFLYLFGQREGRVVIKTQVEPDENSNSNSFPL